MSNSTFLGKIDCPSCGREQALNMWEEDGERTGYCFHDDCKTYYNTKALSEIPESDVPYVEKEPQDITWVESLQSRDNPERGLMRGAYNHFGVKHGVSTQDGRTITDTYYPLRDSSHVITGYKVRLHNPKKFYALGTVRKAMPFGWKEALEVGSYALYITEGEEDAIAVFTAWMREKKQKVSVISLKQGSSSVVKSLQPILKEIMAKFKQAVFLPDADDAGSTATKDIRALFPAEYPVLIASYTEKDANDMVLAGKEKELVNACYRASVPLSGAIKEFTLEDFEMVKQAPEFGLSYPYQGLTELLRGIRLGTTVYVAAPEKAGKCLRTDTPVRLADGSVVSASDVMVGDYLLGVNGPVKVIRNDTGCGKLIEIKQNKGMDFWVTPNHTLCYYSEGNYKEREVKDIAPYDWEKGQQFHVKVEEFEVWKDREVWNPYLVGVWLGDGHKGNARCTLNKEDAPYILEGEKHHPVRDYDYASGSVNVSLIDFVKEYHFHIHEKYIPEEYLYASVENRQQLLAGLLDTDGHLTKSTYEITVKQRELAVDIQMLAKSLGFRATLKEKKGVIKSLSFEGTYYRVHISGAYNLPCRVPRKQLKGEAKRNPCRTGFSKGREGWGWYSSIEVEGDPRFLLEDYTVVHNSTLVNELATHLMLTHNEPVFAIKPEESEEGTLRRMAGAAVGKIFYDPKVEVDKAAVDRAAQLLAGKLFVLERNQTPRWDEVRQLMREAYLARGIKYFFIDPITNLTTGMSSSERDTFLHAMTREVAEDAKSLGYTVFLFCHLKTVRDGLAWSEGRVATADDFQGSRAMLQACDVGIAMQAWMLTEGDNHEYLNRRRVLHVIREREYNAVGKVDLLWNSYKGKLEEVEDE
jgi:Zn ribbon nucleic-acid-binding protein